MSTTSVVGAARSPVNGQPLAGVDVFVELCTPGFDGQQRSVQGVGRRRTARDGSFSLPLTPNVELNPSGTWYRVRIGNGGPPWSIVVPVAATAQLEDCLVDDPEAPGMVAVGGSGSATTLDAIAGQSLSGHRIVRASADGAMSLASNAVAGDALLDLFLTLNAAAAGAAVTLQPFGRVLEPSWSWSPGPVWLGVAGVLTQTLPTRPAAAFLRCVGTAISPMALFVNPQPAFQLA